MSDTPYTPKASPSHSDQAGATSSFVGTYATGYQQSYPAPYPAPQQPQGKKPTNVGGLVALSLGFLGFILGCIPDIIILGWPLLFTAFVTGIVSLFHESREKVTPLIAIALSIVGAWASGIVLFYALSKLP